MKLVYRIGFICLLLVNVLLLFCLKLNKRQVVSEEDKEILQLEKDCMFMYEYNNKNFPLETKLFSIEGKETSLNEIMTGNTFIMWYPQHNCTLCFRESLDQFFGYNKIECENLIAFYLFDSERFDIFQEKI